MHEGQRKGDIAALPQAGNNRVDILGSAVPLRARDEPSPSIVADLSNVVPFLRPRKHAETRDAPAIVADAATRPAPWLNAKQRDRIVLFVGCSIAAHLGLYAFFDREPQPLASIGLESITVEIVLGANMPAGLAKTPNKSEISSAAAPEEPRPQEVKPETARKQPEPSREPEVKIAAAEIVKPDAKPAEQPKTTEPEVKAATEAKAARPDLAKSERAPAQALPVEPTPLPQKAEFAADPKPVEAVQPNQPDKPTEIAAIAKPVEKPQPNPTEIAPLTTPVENPELKQPDRPTDANTELKSTEKLQQVEPEKMAPTKETPKKPPEVKRARDDAKQLRDRAAPASTPSVASNSVGRGRSDADTNYRGLVAAHLARFKQFPSDARSRGDQGTATITFGLDGGGRVTSVRLARGSGIASLDQESQAMVHRASPFPAPPAGHAMSFTVPIDFALR